MHQHCNERVSKGILNLLLDYFDCSGIEIIVDVDEEPIDHYEFS